MKHDLNPRWTTTGTPSENGDQSSGQFSETKDEWPSGEMESPRRRIRVRRGVPVATAIVGTIAGICGIAFTGFVFLQGTLLLQASITGDAAPDHTILLSEQGFDSVDVEVGDTIEFRNSLSTVEEYRSEMPDATTGMPLITTTAIAAGGSVRIKIPEAAAGKEVLLISGFNPSRRGMIKVAVGDSTTDDAGGDIVPESVPTLDQDPSLVSDEELEAAIPLPSLTQQKNSGIHNASDDGKEGNETPVIVTPQMQNTAQVPIPQPEVQATTPIPEETLSLGAMLRPSQISLPWPTALRMNRYTVGSPLVPDLSHAVSIPSVINKTHKAGGDAEWNTAGMETYHSPATGPELWVLGLLSIAIVPVYLIRRRA